MKRGKKPATDYVALFWKKVDKKSDDECWEWTACISKKSGYGRFSVGYPKVEWAHRYSYSIHFGEIPKGKFVMHKCDNRKCVNPNHLTLGNHKLNMKDMTEKGRAACRGEKSWSTSLKDADIIKIREDYADGVRADIISSEHKITACQVRAIASGKYWRHLAGPITKRREYISDKFRKIKPQVEARIKQGDNHQSIANDLDISLSYIKKVAKELRNSAL